MSAELVYFDPQNPGLTNLYTVLRAGVNMVKVSNGALQAIASGNWRSSVIALSDTGHPGQYVGDLPAGAPAMEYRWQPQQASGVPATTALINDPVFGTEDVYDRAVNVLQIGGDAGAASQLQRQLASVLHPTVAGGLNTTTIVRFNNDGTLSNSADYRGYKTTRRTTGEVRLIRSWDPATLTMTIDADDPYGIIPEGGEIFDFEPDAVAPQVNLTVSSTEVRTQ